MNNHFTTTHFTLPGAGRVSSDIGITLIVWRRGNLYFLSGLHSPYVVPTPFSSNTWILFFSEKEKNKQNKTKSARVFQFVFSFFFSFFLLFRKETNWPPCPCVLLFPTCSCYRCSLLCLLIYRQGRRTATEKHRPRSETSLKITKESNEIK